MGKTKIEWCDYTANAWRGCAKVHWGCANCYAAELAKRFPERFGTWGLLGVRVINEKVFDEVRRWDRQAAREGVVRRVFWNDVSDLFEDRSDLAAPRRDVFHTIDECHNLTHILVTKRPENIRRFWPPVSVGKNEERLGRRDPWHRSNVWLLCSASGQTEYDVYAPILWQCRPLVDVLGWSLEPLLDQIFLFNNFDGKLTRNWWRCWDWIIIGGESGRRARWCDVAWVHSLIKQCRDSLPCFVKQLGSAVRDMNTTSATTFSDGECWPRGTEYRHHRILLKHPKGGDMDEWPADFRVREYPQFH